MPCGPRSRRASATASGSRSPTSSVRRRPDDDQPWAPINGSEQVILGDLSILADGAPVQIAPDNGEPKVAAEHAVSRPTKRLRLRGTPALSESWRLTRPTRPTCTDLRRQR